MKKTCEAGDCDVEFEPNSHHHRFHAPRCRKREKGRRERYDRPVERDGQEADTVEPPPMPRPPKGWTAGVKWDGEVPYGTSLPTVEMDPDEKRIVELMGVDPDVWAIAPGTLKVTTWNQQRRQDVEPNWLKAYRGQLVERETLEATAVDVEACKAEIAAWQPDVSPPEWTLDKDDSFVVVLSDWQTGKDEGNGGTNELVGRILRSVDAVEGRIRELRAAGRPLSELVVLLLGDLVEGCDGFYAQQTFTVDRDRRSQVKIVRRLIRDALKRWVPLFGRVTVAAVAGNHGENRKDGRSYTTFADNDDVAVVEQVADILSETPIGDRIQYAIPSDRLHQTVWAGGVPIGIAHGHQLGGGAKAHSGRKALVWWKDQAFGLDALNSARLLFTGHFHHFTCTQFAHEDDGAGRWHFQAPAMDGGSDWFKERSGESATAATLTLRVSAAEPLGWSDLAVLT